MKKRAVVLIVLVSIFFIYGRVYSSWALSYLENAENLLDSSGINEVGDKVSDEVWELMRELGIKEISVESMIRLAPKDFLRVSFALIKQEVSKPIKSAAMVIGIVIIMGITKALREGLENEGGKGMEIIGSLCAAAAVVVPVTENITRTSEAISASGDFMISFVPVYSGIITANGQPISAAGYNTALFAAAQVSSSIANNILVPLVSIFLALSLVGAAVSEYGLDEIAGTVKSAVCWGLGLILTVFIGILSLQTFVTASADGVTVKAAKFVVSSFVPVVGGALSEAYNTAQGCVKLLKSTVGSFGIIAVAVMNLPTVVNSLLWMAVTKIASVISGAVGAQSATKALKASNAAVTILFAINLTFILLMIVSTALMISVGTK